MRLSKLQKIITKDILEKEYNNLGSMQKVADKLKISVDSVYKYMKFYEIPYAKHYQGIYDCNETIFATNTPESFYLAGFIAADGSIQEREYTKILKITLSNKDRLHLEKIKKILDSNHPIKEYTVPPSELVKKSHKCVELQIASKIICNDLKRFNIVKNKTFIYKMPKWLIKHPLIHHFMRGYFDGDGCVTFCGLGKGRNIKQLSFGIIGTYKFIKEFQSILIKNCKLNISKIIQKDKIYGIQYCGNSINKRIYNFLYADATIYLDRKRDRFINTFNKQ